VFAGKSWVSNVGDLDCVPIVESKDELTEDASKVAEAHEADCNLIAAYRTAAPELARKLEEAIQVMKNIPKYEAHDDLGYTKLRDQGFVVPCCEYHDWLRENGFGRVPNRSYQEEQAMTKRTIREIAEMIAKPGRGLDGSDEDRQRLARFALEIGAAAMEGKAQHAKNIAREAGFGERP
jgi:hypothetical protein